MTAPAGAPTRAMVQATTERQTRAVDDVAHLPDSAFGHRDLMWWGTVGFMVIEGFTLALGAVVIPSAGPRSRARTAAARRAP